MSLEERITAALSDEIASSDLAALIADAEEAITAADAAAQHERARALDPIVSPDPVKARAAMEGAAFTRDRLRTVLPRLHARLKQVEAAEYLAQWEPEYERVKAVRDALAAEMREAYPAATAQLVDLFQRAAECDRESSRINGSAPRGDQRRLLKVELTARGVEGLMQPDVYLAETLRLPFFWRETGPLYAWPPPVPSLAQQMALAMLANPAAYRDPPVAVTPEQIKARDEERQREGERVIAYYKERDRVRQEREAAEARAANEHEIERRRREGWPI